VCVCVCVGARLFGVATSAGSGIVNDLDMTSLSKNYERFKFANFDGRHRETTCVIRHVSRVANIGDRNVKNSVMGCLYV
jgi:hypothetical protein